MNRGARVAAIALLAACVAALAGWLVRAQGPEPLALAAANNAIPQMLSRPPRCPSDPRVMFVPTAAVDALVTFYGATNADATSPVVRISATSDASQVALLIRDLNALPGYPCGGLFCPPPQRSGSPAMFTISLLYASAPSVIVRLIVGVCGGLFFGDSQWPAALNTSTILFPLLYKMVGAPLWS